MKPFFTTVLPSTGSGVSITSGMTTRTDANRALSGHEESVHLAKLIADSKTNHVGQIYAHGFM